MNGHGNSFPNLFLSSSSSSSSSLPLPYTSQKKHNRAYSGNSSDVPSPSHIPASPNSSVNAALLLTLDSSPSSSVLNGTKSNRASSDDSLLVGTRRSPSQSLAIKHISFFILFGTTALVWTVCALYLTEARTPATASHDQTPHLDRSLQPTSESYFQQLISHFQGRKSLLMLAEEEKKAQNDAHGHVEVPLDRLNMFNGGKEQGSEHSSHHHGAEEEEIEAHLVVDAAAIRRKLPISPPLPPPPPDETIETAAPAAEKNSWRRILMWRGLLRI